MNQLLEAALQYAARGWRVLPLHSVWHKDKDTPVCTCRRGIECPSKGKHPRFDKISIPNGLKDATTDRVQIEKWWGKWPQANVGIATGDGLTVMDIDGEEGRNELLALAAAHPGNFPTTLAVRTGSGAHLYWKLAGPGNSAKGHLHIRGEEGLVVAPPSLHRSGKHYEWANQEGVSAPPEWLATWFRQGGDSAKLAQQRPTRELAVLALAPDAPAWVVAKQVARLGATRLVDSASIETPWTAHEEARLRGALAAIPASIPGDMFDNYGRGLHHLKWFRADGSSIGFDIWNDWAATSVGRGDGLGLYQGRQDLESRWKRFERTSGTYQGAPVTIASIFSTAAKTYGWGGELGYAPGMNGHTVEGTNGHTFNFGQTFSVGTGGPIFVDLTEKGKPRATCVNSRIALEGLGITCRHDKFHDKLEVGGQIMGQWAGELTDNAVHMLRVAIHEAYRFDPGTIAAHDAAVQECLSNGYDPVADYLDGLEWDKTPRLENWMTSYLGAEPSRLNSAIGMLGLVAACRRVRVPGAKFDAITVFISNEGHGKSSAVEVLAGESNFSDAPILNIDERAQQEAMQGVWLYEIADLAGMSKADTDKVKAFASRRIDRARPAYARSRIDRPRRCVFYATTNLQHFLKSQTGNRRFWPVQVGRIKLDDLARDRNQLWAEASAIERAGVPLGLPEALWGEAAAIQMERMEGDPWDDILAHMKPGEVYEISSADGLRKEHRAMCQNLLDVHLKIAPDRQTDALFKRLGNTMRRLGWDGPRPMRFHGNDGKSFVARGFVKNA